MLVRMFVHKCVCSCVRARVGPVRVFVNERNCLCVCVRVCLFVCLFTGVFVHVFVNESSLFVCS